MFAGPKYMCIEIFSIKKTFFNYVVNFNIFNSTVINYTPYNISLRNAINAPRTPFHHSVQTGRETRRVFVFNRFATTTGTRMRF